MTRSRRRSVSRTGCLGGCSGWPASAATARGWSARRQPGKDDHAMKHDGAIFSMGPGTYAVPMRLHAENRRRLAERLRANGAEAGGVVLLEGGEAQFRYDTDTEEHFKQESFFKWAFGVKEPGF